jgi:alkylation response protein AidB-like acyl-CoA dehydrogenase
MAEPNDEKAVPTDVAAVAAEVESFLRAELPSDWVAAIDAGDAAALRAARGRLDEAQWWRRLGESGYIAPTWPQEYGGLGANRAAAIAVSRTLSRYRVPNFSLGLIGLDLVGPAIMQWGTGQQKRELLLRIVSREHVWCQLFSEPGAGSDLAGLSTRAVRSDDGDEWRVSGQKVWSSFAHEATHGILLARTNPDVPKHEGITVFLIAMDQPGITVRPLRHIAGDVEFNEVFLDDAVVSDDMRLGELGDGWKITVSVLLNERQSASGSGGALPGTTTGRSVDALVRRHAPVADPLLRQRLAKAYIDDLIVQVTSRRAAARRKRGEEAGSEGSVLKVLATEHAKELQDLAVDLEGVAGQAWVEDDQFRQKTAWSLMRVQSKTISGGTSEIQRNILGERILGLPKEPGDDRNTPWAKVRRS